MRRLSSLLFIVLIVVTFMASQDMLAQESQHELYYVALNGYKPNYWHNSKIVFDADGVPMVDYGDGNPRYNPTTAAQYALSLFNEYLDTGEQGALDKFDAVAAYLLRSYEVRAAGIAYPYNFALPAYGLEPGWVSAIAQGQVLSVLRRAYYLNPDQHVVEIAMGAQSLLLSSVADGGTLAVTPEGELWLEEAPSITPSLILNGNMFAVIGLYDYVQMAPEDMDAKAMYSQVLRGVERSIGYYDTEDWLLYDRYRLGNIHPSYLNIHVQLARHFHFITADPFYYYLAEKWSRYTAPLPTPTLEPTDMPQPFVIFIPLASDE